MKKALLLVAAAVSALSLAGCEVVPPKLKVKPVVIDIEGGGGGNGGGFCPPGQAKKGNC